jgi:Ca2+-binding EF-hand superfamily protein
VWATSKGDINVQRQREACESIRILIFGAVGNEDWPVERKFQIFEQRRGTQAEVQTFVEQWMDLDKNRNGEVEFGEFMEYFAKRSADKLLGMRCVRFLIGSLDKEGDGEGEDDRWHGGGPPATPGARRKSKGSLRVGCTKEEMMRLIWLQASDSDIAEMATMFDLYKLRMASVVPLPLLSKKKSRELVESFQDLDREGRGLVAFSEMSESGLVDDVMARELKSSYDKDGSGTFDLDKFCEMLCPFGYRAHERVDKAIDKSGRTMHFVRCPLGESAFEGWILETDLQLLRDEYPQMSSGVRSEASS